MILHLEFAFWVTWQMREQAWHICQAAHGLAKDRSRVSPGPPRDLDFLRAIYRDREQHHRRRPLQNSRGIPSRQSGWHRGGTCNESDTSRRGGTCIERWGAGRTDGTNCEKNARTAVTLRAGRRSRAHAKEKNHSRVHFG